MLEFIISEMGSGLLCWIYDMTDSQTGAANHAVCLLYKAVVYVTSNESLSETAKMASYGCSRYHNSFLAALDWTSNLSLYN